MFCVFMGILFSVGPSGTPSFVARRKIGEKGVPKGSKAALWKLAFLYGGSEGRRADFSTCAPGCNLRDLGPSVACFALLPRTLLYCSNCGEFVGAERYRPDLWSEVRWFRKSPCLSEQRSTQSAWKQCGARHARLNRVTRTIANT